VIKNISQCPTKMCFFFEFFSNSNPRTKSSL